MVLYSIVESLGLCLTSHFKFDLIMFITLYMMILCKF